MTDNAKRFRLTAVALLAAVVAGCSAQGGTPDDRMGRFLVAPDKYLLFNCEQLAEQTKTTAARESELLALMAKAGPSGGGQLVSAVAYRPEYLERHGELNELHRAAAAKNCKPLPGRPAARAPSR